MSTLSNITILPVPPAAFIARWQEVEPLLEKALAVSVGRYLAVDVLSLMIQGTSQGWFITDGDNLLGILVTQLHTFPRRRCLSLFCCAGHQMTDWMEPAAAVITDYAKRLGADHLEVQGRAGWARALGVEQHAVILVKDLKDNGGAM